MIRRILGLHDYLSYIQNQGNLKIEQIMVQTIFK